jgi:2,5-diamino-6-(ribosylamino)-4(3H)-pyrimidinone 5'-phosphate reductase
MLPRVIIHSAISLDGRIDGFSADVGTYYELASRWDPDAMLSGSNTILAAFPNPEGEESPVELTHVEQIKDDLIWLHYRVIR